MNFRRRFSIYSDFDQYAIALNPSRFDIVKTELDNAKRKSENTFYLERLPPTEAPRPPSNVSDDSIQKAVLDDNLYAEVLMPYYTK